MNTQHGTRRWLFGALVVLATALSVLGSGHEAGAAKNDGARPRPGYGSKAAFKLECELLGGKFWVDKNGNTNCRGSGRWVQCDANGNDCWVTPTRHRPRGKANSYDGSIDQVVTDREGSGRLGIRDRQVAHQ